MLAPLLVIVIAFVAWKFTSPGQQFLPAFGRLLTASTVRQGAFNFISGRSYATGQFGGREVAIRLQLRRGEYQVGYLVIAVKTNGPQALDSSGVDTNTRDAAGRRALFTIAGHDLLLLVEDGWLKTMWKPVGFVVFPGRFSQDRWRPVLEGMCTVAASLEASV